MQLARLEGLRQVVVGADLEAGDAVAGVGAGGQHQDRHLRGLAHAPGVIEAGLARHHHVEHEGVEDEARAHGCASRGVGGGGDAVAVLGEEAGEQIAQAPVVVDDEDMRGVVGDVDPGRQSPSCARVLRAGSSSTASRCGATCVAVGRVDHGEQEAARGVLAVARRPSDSARMMRRVCSLARRQRELVALRRVIEQPLAAVRGAGPLLDEVLLDQLLQDPVEALLGDAQDVEQFGDGEAGLPVDEMQDAVMRPAEAVVGEDAVGIADEVAIGEEEQLDQVVGRPCLGGTSLAVSRAGLRAAWRGTADTTCTSVYVSLVDISQPDCYSSSRFRKKLDRAATGRRPAVDV